MGGRVSLVHVDTGLFLDCGPNKNGCVLVTAPPKKAPKDQLWAMQAVGASVVLKADRHPNRKVCVLKDKAFLQRDTTGTVFELVTIRADGDTYTQLRCSEGYLAGPPSAGPVLLVSSGRQRSTLWKVIPKQDKDDKAQSGSLAKITGGPGGQRRGSLTTLVPENSEPSLLHRIVAALWSFLHTLFTSLLRLVGLADPITSPPETPLSTPRTPSFTPEERERLQLLRTTVTSNYFPELRTTVHRAGVVETFELPEGLEQHETIFFRVTKGPITNLRRRITTMKMGIPVDSREQPMGSYEASPEERSFSFPVSPVPSGWHVRGGYRSLTEFLDDNGPCCPSVEKHFTIVKKQ